MKCDTVGINMLLHLNMACWCLYYITCSITALRILNLIWTTNMLKCFLLYSGPCLIGFMKMIHSHRHYEIVVQTMTYLKLINNSRSPNYFYRNHQFKICMFPLTNPIETQNWLKVILLLASMIYHFVK